MFKSTLFTLFAVMLFSSINAQSIRFTQSMYVEYHPEYSEWDAWPSDWTDLGEDTRITMYISEVVRGKVYNVILYLNGEESSNMNVRYDAEQSEKIRKDWDDPYVNCYYDDNGDYIYAQKVSLEQLSKDSTPWQNEESQMYLWVLSENYGIALR